MWLTIQYCCYYTYLENGTLEETPFMPPEPLENTLNNSFKGSLEAQEERAFRHWVEQGRKQSGSSRIIGKRNGKGTSGSFYKRDILPYR